MARDFVDIALIELDGKELTTVRSFSPKAPDPSNPVKTMNRRRRPLGFTHGVPDFSADLEVAIPKGAPEVDWRELKRTKQKFLLTWEEAEGGRRRSLVDCEVSDCSPTFDEGGEVRMSVSVVALDERSEG
jgi:hypothetical protein